MFAKNRLMPRKPFTQTDNPYHIAVRCINKDWFKAPMSEVWDIMSEKLLKTQLMYHLQVHSFVLMQNHLHMIASAPEMNLSFAMSYFLRESSRNLLKATDRINCTFNKRYFRSSLNSPHSFPIAYKYVYRNPVEAGICKRVEEYPYSTLNGILGFSRLRIKLEPDHLLHDGKMEINLAWLNTNPEDHLKFDVRQALKKETFILPRYKGKIHPLLNTPY